MSVENLISVIRNAVFGIIPTCSTAANATPLSFTLGLNESGTSLERRGLYLIGGLGLVNVLSYFAILASLAMLLEVDEGTKVLLALVASICGLFSTICRYQALIKHSAAPMIGKVIIGLVAASALIVSPWISNGAIATLTLMPPDEFENAYKVFSLIGVMFLWGAALYFIAVAIAAFQFVSSVGHSSAVAVGFKGSLPAALGAAGRAVGLGVLIVYLMPFLFKAVNHDSGGLLSWLIVQTEFFENRAQERNMSSYYPELPKGCIDMAKKQGVSSAETYLCVARTHHCANLPDNALIKYSDAGKVIVAEKVSKDSPLFELNQWVFIEKSCDTSKRYDLRVEPISAPPLAD